MVIYIVYAKGENMTVFINVPVTVEINKLLEGSQNIKFLAGINNLPCT
jgi:hypothetical protein